MLVPPGVLKNLLLAGVMRSILVAQGVRFDVLNGVFLADLSFACFCYEKKITLLRKKRFVVNVLLEKLTHLTYSG